MGVRSDIGPRSLPLDREEHDQWLLEQEHRAAYNPRAMSTPTRALAACPICGGLTVVVDLYHPVHFAYTLPVRSCVDCHKAAVSGAQLLAFARRVGDVVVDRALATLPDSF